MGNGWELEEDAVRLFESAIRSTAFDVIAKIDGKIHLVTICRSLSRTLSMRVYPRDWMKMKQWAEENGWGRVALIYSRGKWYKVSDMLWLDQKIASSKVKLMNIGIVKKAVMI